MIYLVGNAKLYGWSITYFLNIYYIHHTQLSYYLKHVNMLKQKYNEKFISLFIKRTNV